MFSSTPTPLPNTAHDAEYAGRVQGHTVRRAQETARFHGSTLPFMLFCTSGRAREASSSLHGGTGANQAQAFSDVLQLRKNSTVRK